MKLAILRIPQTLLIPLLVFFFPFSSFSLAEIPPNYSFVKHATQAPLVSYHDYIIVGGGTAGCPLAATLSENFDVLLLERGGSPYGNTNITEMASLVTGLLDTSPSSPVQHFVSDDGVPNARARVLGGGSSINVGFYSRASPAEVRAMKLDARLANDSYRWVEKAVAFEPRLVAWTAAFRDGLLEAGVRPDNGFTYDHVHGTKVGGTIFNGHGRRHTAADLLQYADPARLTVLLRAPVQRILFAGQRTEAYGVVYKDERGVTKTAYLKRNIPASEIIISAGAMGSPQLLMLSGVGPAEHLRSLGISVVLDRPMVGQGMSDNPLSGIIVASPVPVDFAGVQVVGVAKTGNYVESICSPDLLSLITMFRPPSAVGQMAIQVNRLTPTEVKKKTYQLDTSSTIQGGIIGEKLARPLSRGYLKLKNTDPADNPSVTFNYYTEPEDLKQCVEGIRVMQRVIASKAFSKFTYTNSSAQGFRTMYDDASSTSKDLENLCRDFVCTIWHFHGGCQVNRVVDQEYRVLGVDALRVVDGSTFDFSPGTNPQATLMMLGRYMGIKIQNKRAGAKRSKRKSYQCIVFETLASFYILLIVSIVKIVLIMAFQVRSLNFRRLVYEQFEISPLTL